MSPTNLTHTPRMLLAALCLVTAGALLTSCSSPSDAASSDGPSSASASAEPQEAAGVAFAECMRENGITDFADPTTDSQGGVQLSVPEGVDPESPAFTAAVAACQSLLTQGDAGGAAGSREFDASKVADWAECIRSNGLPSFEDPQIDGTTIVVDADAAGISGRDDPAFAKATEACYSIRPGGTLMVQTGGGQ